MTLAETTTPAAGPGRGEPWISFDTDPGRYRHWKLAIDGQVATLALDTAEDGGLHPGYALKLNSYDLGVDIELHDAVQRLRFEHPEVRAVILTSAKDGVFCAGANIKMLAQASHPLKVNFCKLTNETRLAIEEASACSGQVYLAAVNGAASGGGYEIALATEHILLVDELAPKSRLAEAARARAEELAGRSDRPADATGVALPPLERELEADRIAYPNLTVELDRSLRLNEQVLRHIIVHAEEVPPPRTIRRVAVVEETKE